MSNHITVQLSRAQAEALCFAASNAIEEPANFERGSGNEATEAPLRIAHFKIILALADLKAEAKP